MRYVLAFGLVAAATSADATVRYGIDLSAPEHHTGQVTAVFPVSSGPYLDVKMPAWRTGRYTIMNLANGVRSFSAVDPRGRPLRWEKTDKSTWRIYLQQPGPVQISYELYANELLSRSRHIDDTHAYLDASAVFMYADRYRGEDVSVALQVPSGWDSVSGMDSAGRNRFVAKNWDTLVDSPIETGIHQTYHFKEGQRDYDVVFWGEGNYDAPSAVADLKKIVGQAGTIWGAYPFRRYLFIIHAHDENGGGATEHLNSTVMQFPRYMFHSRRGYLAFLSTASHEFIHTWNVKSYRGAGLVPYDYDKENYSDLLWVAEGSTSYFEDQPLLQTGLMKPHEYFDVLAQTIDQHRHTPGAAVQSVADASFNEWISVSGDRAKNASVDIYTQGSIVSWMLDIALLQQTQGRVSYRDVHKALYQRFLSGRAGFTDRDMLDILQQLTGTSWEPWWRRSVQAPVAVDFDALLAPVGLKLVDPAGNAAWAGWTGDQGEGGMRLATVEKGSPAWNAGFVPDDIIVALDGHRAGKDRFEAAIDERRAGDTVTVTYFRHDKLAQKTMKLGSTPDGPPTIVPVASPTAGQKALFQRWLQIPYPAAS
ncbi:putative metalloprotease with PDZ domain [Sphingomonas sp. F9_3S_D5_B_2]